MRATPPNEESLFAEALAQCEGGRAAFLDQACGGDVALRARIAALLAAHESPHFESPIVERTAIASLPKEKPGDLIGRYKLLQQIGEGGCGVVWMAEQEEPVRRRVALKVIKLGMDTKAVIARFEAERQALAMMDHPNIAKVFDAGATETGRPYFVMELVRGVPITRFCDENNLATRPRLELFVQVCHAIQHAHQKGIIHRDIKPSNVLVTLHDDVAVPMVIDFGIAKATQGRLTAQTLFTAFEQFLGTPVYMSPEQAEFNALDVDTRSDVYSLGVLLYELLTGRPPFDPKALRDAGIERIRQIIRETDPLRPSTRVRTLTDAERTTVAKVRSTAPAQLSTLLRGDLDWIVLKAIEKNRTRRYQTANAFALDIQRSLTNEVVVARPPSRAYRLAKFIARHRVGFAAAAGAVALLMVGLAFSTASFLHEKAARKVADQQASRTDVDLANRAFDDGKPGDGLAYLLRAARRDPGNRVVAPRLLSALTTHNFLLPEGTPLALPSPAQAAAFMADGKEIFVLGEDGAVRFIDVATWRIAREFRFGRKILPHGWALAEKNAGFFALFFKDETFVVCDTATGRQHFAPIRLPRRADDGNPRIAFSPDGRWLASAQLVGSVWVWDAATGELRATLPNETPASNDNIIPYIFAPDSQSIVTTYGERITQRWSLPGGVALGKPIRDPFKSNFRNAMFSPDGRLLLNYWEGAQFFDLATGEPIGERTLRLGSRAHAIAFSPDGRRAVVNRMYLNPFLTDASLRSDKMQDLPHGGRVREMRFSDDGRILFTNCADGLARVWNVENGNLLVEPTLQQDRSMPAVMAPDGSQLFLFSTTGPAYRLRIGNHVARPLVLPEDAQTWTLLLPELPNRFIRFTPDRAEAFTTESARATSGGGAYPEPVPASYDAANGVVKSLFFESNGRAMIARTGKKEWRAWITRDGAVAHDVLLEEIPNGSIPSFSFSRDAKRVAIFHDGQEQSFSVWSMESGRPALTIRFDGRLSTSESGFGRGVSFSPDDHRLVFVTADGVVHVCDAKTGAEELRLELPERARLTNFTLSATGTRLFTADTSGAVHAWDLTSGQLIRSTQRHRDVAAMAGRSPDGREVISHSLEGTLQIWDALTGVPRGAPMVVGRNLVWGMFLESGAILSTDRATQTGRIWEPATGQPVTNSIRGGGLISPGPDGRFIAIRIGQETHIHSLVPIEGPAPRWLLRLATAFAGKRLRDSGEFITDESELARIDELRREVNALPANAPYAEWGRWLLADPATRSIAPGFTLTPREAEEFAMRVKPAPDPVDR